MKGIVAFRMMILGSQCQKEILADHVKVDAGTLSEYVKRSGSSAS
ncbi:MAG: hypothetical protein ABR962_00955 [Candidatus Bathyarchaeia archaeon]